MRSLAAVLAIAGSAHADPWRCGASTVSRIDPEGDGGLGLAVQAVQERPWRAFGFLLEHTWLFPQRQELGVRQLDAIGLVRWAAPFALELGGGLAIYHGRVDIPEMEGCFRCGKYSGTSVAPLARAGVVWTRELRGELALVVGARLVLTRALVTKTDVHSFDPRPVTLQTGVGATSQFLVVARALKRSTPHPAFRPYSPTLGKRALFFLSAMGAHTVVMSDEEDTPCRQMRTSFCSSPRVASVRSSTH